MPELIYDRTAINAAKRRAEQKLARQQEATQATQGEIQMYDRLLADLDKAAIKGK